MFSSAHETHCNWWYLVLWDQSTTFKEFKSHVSTFSFHNEIQLEISNKKTTRNYRTHYKKYMSQSSIFPSNHILQYLNENNNTADSNLQGTVEAILSGNLLLWITRVEEKEEGWTNQAEEQEQPKVWKSKTQWNWS